MEIDLSRLDEKTRARVDEIFRGDHELRVLEAMKRQTQIAARNHRGERSRDGFGARAYEVDAVFDAIWRQVYGPGYSADPDLMKFLLKRNPEIGVKTTGTKIQVGWAPTETRHRKRYEWPAPTPNSKHQAPEKHQN